MTLISARSSSPAGTIHPWYLRIPNSDFVLFSPCDRRHLNMLVPPPTPSTSWRDASAIPSTSPTSAGAQRLPCTGHVLPATSPWSPLRGISPEASMRWFVTFLQWPLATDFSERRDPAAGSCGKPDDGQGPVATAPGTGERPC